MGDLQEAAVVLRGRKPRHRGRLCGRGAISAGLNFALTGGGDDPTLIGSLVNWLLGTLISMGATALYLRAHDNPDAVSLASLWHPQPYLAFLAATVLVGLAIAVGFILLIVPGIIFALMFMFTTLIVIDRELGPIEAMKESKRITTGYKWPLLGLVILLALINVLGAAVFGIGLLVSIPVSMLAFVHAYRSLSGKPETRPADATLAA